MAEDTSGGWWDMVLRGTLEQCIWAGNSVKADWAHIVDMETAQVVRWKKRDASGPPLDLVPWSVGHDADIPLTFGVLLSFQELCKLSALGGSRWVRAQLAKATVSPALAEVATASAMLHLIQGCPLPFLVSGPQAILVEELQQNGLLRAEFTYADSQEEDTATVLAITDKGREALAGNAVSNTASRPSKAAVSPDP
ncbi:MAG: hypothetical protein ACK59X_17470 [Acidovorax sp.]